ncbi:MAG TPA: lamin tail domain-containing protein, partial [Thermomicrobiales bacterium]|nr:lamin tail domain-containing protein [Thermomicrobiales bacterium]
MSLRRVVAGLLIAAVGLSLAPAASAEPIEHTAFERTWARTDMPLVTRQTLRTWMWGPAAASTLLSEPYASSPGGTRIVQYFDKSRMEINNRDGDRASPWYVTNGLLASELISGRLAVGDTAWLAREPAVVNVAGDPDDPAGPTYATFAALLGASRPTQGAPIVATLARDGSVGANPWLAQWGATDAEWVALTGHWVASPFWAFMQSQGVVYEGGIYASEPLFENPYYATGYPITDAYWANVRVGGTASDVLVQCFERRCLTYTPTNTAEWQVEAGNIGQHYYTWRYDQAGETPAPARIATGDLRIDYILPDPSWEEGAEHEYVVIRNYDEVTIHLKGWLLRDESGTTFTFPDV